MKKKCNIAIIGATGMVGTAVLSILEERKFPVDQLYLLASKRSAGESRYFADKQYSVSSLEKFNFQKTQICFFCASPEIAAEYAPLAAREGNVVIDKSSCFRYDEDVPLIVPEVNLDALSKFKEKNIIANPNCSTIPIVMALKPIYDAVGISRLNIATYQSVSGTGKEAVRELADQTIHLLNGQPIKPKVYPQQIAFNVLPHIDHFMENGYTKEEMKIIWETHKILNDNSIIITPTAVRVPIFYGHSAAVHIETKTKLSKEHAISLLSNFPGIKVLSSKNAYPTPAHNAAGKDLVYVGRIREDCAYENGLNLWVVCDNVRKGAALNAIQIAEQLLKKYL